MNRRAIVITAIVVLVVLAQQTRSAVGSVMTEDEFTRHDAKIRFYAKKHGVPWRLYKSIMIVESDNGKNAGVGFDKKSVGPMQVRPETADWMLGRPNGTTTMKELENWEFNMDVAGRYLAYLGKYFKASSLGWDAVMEYVIRGYNGGPGYAKTKLGPSMTAVYYAKVLLAMKRVIARQPGPEMEIV